MPIRFQPPSLRSPEIVFIVYFLYVAAAAVFHPVEGLLPRVAIVNLLIVGGYVGLARGPGSRRPLVTALRDWMPLGLIILAYKEMGWFAPASHTNELEAGWIVWDRVLLDDWGFRAAVESLGAFGPLDPRNLLRARLRRRLLLGRRFLHLRETLSAGHFSIALRSRHRSRLCVLSLCSLRAAPHRIPRPKTYPASKPSFGVSICGCSPAGGIHTSVFPSGHVAHAFAAGWGMLRALPEHKWVGRSLLALAVLILMATVYGRYHYAVDSIAGLAVAAARLAITAPYRRRNSDSRIGPRAQATGRASSEPVSWRALSAGPVASCLEGVCDINVGEIGASVAAGKASCNRNRLVTKARGHSTAPAGAAGRSGPRKARWKLSGPGRRDEHSTAPAGPADAPSPGRRAGHSAARKGPWEFSPRLQPGDRRP